ncbi:hypothetical protein ST47_g9498 [Ascochyta rabiei]|uniref:Uncharacterized protein n=1 Tax=Didymella rabiei TaxID=5454 RepID=A0A162X413_DIDRA|nr:hypothetical protein ST47_g9498 [Ascochyta rabiei]
MLKTATDVDVGEDAIARSVALRESKIWERRSRRGATARSLSAEFAAVRWKEVGGILLCHALQQDIDKYLTREDEARERVEEFIGVYGDPDRVSEEDMLALVGAHPDTKLEQKWGRRAKKAIRALAWQIRLLLTYTQLRLKLHVDLARTCWLRDWSGHVLTEEQRATNGEQRVILSGFSSEAEYHVQKGSWSGLEGKVVTGSFTLLDLDYDVTARVREVIARVVSLCPEDNEEE